MLKSLCAALIPLALATFALAQGEAPKPSEPAKPAPAKTAEPPKETGPVQVKLTTSMGEIVVELDAVKAPISTANFLSYTDKGFYNGTTFHRVIPNFMIQGGGYDANMKQKPTDKPIKNEWTNGLKNVRGSIAMARTNDPDSATSQFFINVQDNPNLDKPMSGGAGYAVFGMVVSGMDVVDKIKAVKTGRQGVMGDVPVETVTILKAERASKAGDAPKKPETPPSPGSEKPAPDKK